MKNLVQARFTPWYDTESDYVEVWVLAKIKSDYSTVKIYDFTMLNKE